jgi:membrane protease YdiL (CAAX protease family)
MAAGSLVRLALLAEFGCLALALFLGWLGWSDHRQPAEKLLQVAWLPVLGWTVVGLGASGLIAGAMVWIPLRSVARWRVFVLEQLAPLFRDLSIAQVAVISASAGIGEEMLFRWSLQGGLQHLWPGTFGSVLALLLASFVFGLAHAVNAVYVWMATIMGAALGGIMLLSGSVVPAILAHAVYDFVAILVLQRMAPQWLTRASPAAVG